MSVIKIDLSKKLGKMKPMHGGGQPPLLGHETTHFHYMTEAGIPYSRLHDVGGPYGGGRYVDIPNLFRDFDADENDPASYDFTFTDLLMKALVEAKVEPYFRLGITIENAWDIKTYRTDPPKDYAKWARICEHVIMHYTEGWADGFHYHIKYWEFWNEPEGEMMWKGSYEDFYRLYDVLAKHLKPRFPNIAIGAYGSWGFRAIVPDKDKPSTAFEYRVVEFFEGFFKYIKEHNTPIDFFSWHSYLSTKRTVYQDEWLHKKLTEFGYGDLETHINEWNTNHYEFGHASQSAACTATMIAMQNGHPAVMCIYDMRTNTAPYCPLFDIRTHKPIHTYYALVAFNALYKLGTQVETVCDTEDLYVLAASDGKKNALLISNQTGEAKPLQIEGVDLTDARFYVLDEERLLSWAPNANMLQHNEVVLIEW